MWLAYKPSKMKAVQISGGLHPQHLQPTLNPQPQPQPPHRVPPQGAPIWRGGCNLQVPLIRARILPRQISQVFGILLPQQPITTIAPHCPSVIWQILVATPTLSLSRTSVRTLIPLHRQPRAPIPSDLQRLRVLAPSDSKRQAPVLSAAHHSQVSVDSAARRRNQMFSSRHLAIHRSSKKLRPQLKSKP